MDLETIADQLVTLRRKGALGAAELNQVASLDDAYFVQDAAVAALEGSIIGYTITGTSEQDRRRLGLEQPIYGELLDTENTEDLKMPQGIIGIAPAVCYVFGSTYPTPGQEIDLAGLKASIACAYGAIRIFGRRVPSSIRLTSITAAADFGLNAGFCRGPRLESLGDGESQPVEVAVQIDEQVIHQSLVEVAKGPAIQSVLWLANELAGKGRFIEAGMAIVAGAATPIFQVTAGHTATATFDGLSPLRLRLR